MSATPSAADIVREFLPTSPFVAHLGMKLSDMAPDRVTLELPFRDSLVTIGTTVHSGALASLIDTAAMVAAWSGAETPENLRGTTVALSITFLAPADGEDVVADASVLRRGRNLAFVDVDVRTVGGRSVAKGLVTYKLG